MNLQQIIILVVMLSIMLTVFGFGLEATIDDLLCVVRNPSLLARSLLAMFVVMPIVAVLLARLFDFSRTADAALVTLAISPVPPLLPAKQGKAGGRKAYAIGLLATMGVLSIVIVPLSVEVLARYLDKPLSVAPSVIAGIVLKMVLLPLAAGIALRAALPALAEYIAKPAALVAKVVLSLGVLVILASSAPEIWGLIGNGTVLAIALFVVLGLAVGHLLGGSDDEHRLVLALSTACRHPGVALAIVAANAPGLRPLATLLLYLVLSGLLGIPYLSWLQHRSAAKEAPAV